MYWQLLPALSLWNLHTWNAVFSCIPSIHNEADIQLYLISNLLVHCFRFHSSAVNFYCSERPVSIRDIQAKPHLHAARQPQHRPLGKQCTPWSHHRLKTRTRRDLDSRMSPSSTNGEIRPPTSATPLLNCPGRALWALNDSDSTDLQFDFNMAPKVSKAIAVKHDEPHGYEFFGPYVCLTVHWTVCWLVLVLAHSLSLSVFHWSSMPSLFSVTKALL